MRWQCVLVLKDDHRVLNLLIQECWLGKVVVSEIVLGIFRPPALRQFLSLLLRSPFLRDRHRIVLIILSVGLTLFTGRQTLRSR